MTRNWYLLNGLKCDLNEFVVILLKEIGSVYN